MKRKVIQLAGRTFVVSLPSKWVREWGINKGDELEVEEHGSSVSIATRNNHPLQRCSVDLSKSGERVVRWVLSSLHKRGYDELEVKIEHDQQKLINELVKDLFVGFAVVYESADRTVVRAVSSELDDQFDMLLRRIFLVTLSLAELVESWAQSKDCAILDEMLVLEKTTNQLTNFCERILNRRGFQDSQRTCFVYVIVWNLEKIADGYKHIAQYVKKVKVLRPVERELIGEATALLRRYYELFYAFEMGRLNKLAADYKLLEEKMIAELESKPSVVLAHGLAIVQKIADFSASTVALKSKDVG